MGLSIWGLCTDMHCRHGYDIQLEADIWFRLSVRLNEMAHCSCKCLLPICWSAWLGNSEGHWYSLAKEEHCRLKGEGEGARRCFGTLAFYTV